MNRFKVGDQVVCINSTQTARLTKGKVYTILPIRVGDTKNMVWIVSDHGFDDYFRDMRFISLMEHRTQTIDEILI